jgi:hypothetical protein
MSRYGNYIKITEAKLEELWKLDWNEVDDYLCSLETIELSVEGQPNYLQVIYNNWPLDDYLGIDSRFYTEIHEFMYHFLESEELKRSAFNYTIGHWFKEEQGENDWDMHYLNHFKIRDFLKSLGDIDPIDYISYLRKGGRPERLPEAEKSLYDDALAQALERCQIIREVPEFSPGFPAYPLRLNTDLLTDREQAHLIEYLLWYQFMVSANEEQKAILYWMT